MNGKRVFGEQVPPERGKELIGTLSKEMRGNRMLGCRVDIWASLVGPETGILLDEGEKSTLVFSVVIGKSIIEDFI